MGYSGLKHTWSNNREGSEFTKERLDRVCAKIECMTLFQEIHVTTLATCSSYHNPILTTMIAQLQPSTRRARMFGYEYRWGLNNDCKDMISTAWNGQYRNENSMAIFSNKLNRCKVHLLN